MRIGRPRSEPEIGWAGEETWHITTAANHASGQDSDLLTEAEKKAARKERREALARRRPCGFTAIWEEDE